MSLVQLLIFLLLCVLSATATWCSGECQQLDPIRNGKLGLFYEPRSFPEAWRICDLCGSHMTYMERDSADWVDQGAEILARYESYGIRVDSIFCGGGSESTDDSNTWSMVHALIHVPRVCALDSGWQMSVSPQERHYFICEYRNDSGCMVSVGAPPAPEVIQTTQAGIATTEIAGMTGTGVEITTNYSHGTLNATEETVSAIGTAVSENLSETDTIAKQRTTEIPSNYVSSTTATAEPVTKIFVVSVQRVLQKTITLALICWLAVLLLLLLITKSNEPIDVIHGYTCVALLLFFTTMYLMLEVRTHQITLQNCTTIAFILHTISLLVAGSLFVEGLYDYVILTAVASYVSVRQVYKALALSTVVSLAFSALCLFFLRSLYATEQSCWVNCRARAVVLTHLVLPMAVMVLALMTSESAGMHRLGRFPLTCKTSHDNASYSQGILPPTLVIAVVLWITWSLCLCFQVHQLFQATHYYTLVMTLSVLFVFAIFFHTAICSFRVRLLLYSLYVRYFHRLGCCDCVLGRKAEEFAKRHLLADGEAPTLLQVRSIRDGSDLYKFRTPSSPTTSSSVVRSVSAYAGRTRSKDSTDAKTNSPDAEARLEDMIKVMLARTVPSEPVRLWKKAVKETKKGAKKETVEAKTVEAWKKQPRRRDGPQHRYK